MELIKLQSARLSLSRSFSRDDINISRKRCTKLHILHYKLITFYICYQSAVTCSRLHRFIFKNQFGQCSGSVYVLKITIFECISEIILVIFTGSCSPNPCQNSGVCTPVPYGYVCKCPIGYSGDNCQHGTYNNFSLQ